MGAPNSNSVYAGTESGRCTRADRRAEQKRRAEGSQGTEAKAGRWSGKQKEGIIIGSILGMIIGNQSGKGADYREEQREWEARQREIAHRERMRREEQQRIENARRKHVEYCPPVHTHTTSTNRGIVSDEVTQARHRAEQREAELQQEIEIRRIQEERRRALAEFQARERRAQEQLQRLRNGESISQDRPIY